MKITPEIKLAFQVACNSSRPVDEEALERAITLALDHRQSREAAELRHRLAEMQTYAEQLLQCGQRRVLAEAVHRNIVRISRGEP